MRSFRAGSAGVLLCAVVLIGGVGAASGSAPGPTVGPPTPNAPAVPAAVTAPAANQRADVYTALPGCRILDTRSTSPLGNGASRSFYAAGTFGFAPQGGKSGGCGVPVGATSISVSVTAISPSRTGYLRAGAAGSSSSAAILSYTAGGGSTTGGSIALRASSAAQLTVKNTGGPTDLAIEVTGYTRPQVYGTFTDSGALYAGNGTLTGYSHSTTGYYVLQADRDLTGCTPVGSAYYYNFNVSMYASGRYVYLQLTNGSTGAGADYYFQVQVTC